MKARIITLMLVASLLVGGNQASAQIGSFLKDKAKNAMNKKDSENQKKKEEEQKKQEEEKQKQENQQQENQQSNPNPANNFMQRKMMSMMGMNNVKYDMNYDFTSSMSMEMQSTDSLGEKSEKILYTTFFDKNSKSFAMEFEGKDKQTGEKQKSLMIFDYKNWAMLILADKKDGKSGIAMQMTKDSSIEAEQNNPKKEEVKKQEDLSAYNTYYKATGRTKTIAGYKCKEYVYETTEGKAEIWATNDVVFDYSSAYGQMGAQAIATGGTTYGLGTNMEWHFMDKDSQARSDMTVVDIKPSNPKSINLAGYQIIGMGGQQGQEQTKEKGKGKDKGKDKK